MLAFRATVVRRSIPATYLFTTADRYTVTDHAGTTRSASRDATVRSVSTVGSSLAALDVYLTGCRDCLVRDSGFTSGTLDLTDAVGVRTLAAVSPPLR
jgi:hypothetical protein